MTSPIPGPPHYSHPKYRPDIDGLRAVAVLLVVGYHAFPSAVTGGFIGVDVFFVISGFLISTILLENLKSGRLGFAEFYRRRINRIFPALLVVLATSYGIGWFWLIADEFAQLGRHIAASAGFVSNFVLWSESGYFDVASELKPLLHLWSLGIEEQFYVFWPLLLWVGYKARIPPLATCGLLLLVSFTLGLGPWGGDSVARFYSPQTRVWELLVGAMLAIHRLSAQGAPGAAEPLARPSGTRRGVFLANAKSLLGLAAILTSALVLTRYVAFPGWWALLPTVAAALLISAGPQAWVNRWILASPVMVWFGLISYPLYLWHWPLLAFARITEGDVPPPGHRLAAVGCAVLLAWITYQLVERYFRSGGHRGRKAAALIVLMIVVGGAGYDAFRRGGIDTRFPEAVRHLARYEYAAHVNPPGYCFLGTEQDASAFDRCDKLPDSAMSSAAVLWGDSYAAHLYSGYKAVYGDEYPLIQRTAAGCYPIVGMVNPDRPHCKDINDFVIDWITRQKPRKVILAAAWNRGDYPDVEKTIRKLQEIGIREIELVGPSPQWKEPLPKLLFLYYRSSGEIPKAMDFGRDKRHLATDARLSEIASRLGVRYISPIGIMCDEKGCLTRVGDAPEMLTAWDRGHMTRASSAYLVSRFPADSLFAPRADPHASEEARYAAALGAGIDFTRAEYPPFLARVSGVSIHEPWGRWTDGNLADPAALQFRSPLPRRFTLEIAASALAPNLGRPVKVRVGGVERTFVIERGGVETYRLQFETDGTADTLEIVSPQPTQAGNDPRRLGVGLVSIRIREPQGPRN